MGREKKEEGPVSDMLATVKSREVQRGVLAEMRGDAAAAKRHFLAAAHLEIVLASEYAQAGQMDLAVRSHISAASCFWRGGQQEQATSILDSLCGQYPDRAASFQAVLTDLKSSRTVA